MISTSASKSEAMVLIRKQVDCLLKVGKASLLQVKEFKYLLWVPLGVSPCGRGKGSLGLFP